MGVDIEQVIKNVNAAYYIAALIKQEISSTMTEMPLFSFSGTMEVVEDPPSYILDEDVFNLWYLNKTVRCILKTPLWKDKAKKQEYPHFCFNGGFCKYFESGPLLDAHFDKNPNHALETIKAKEMAKSQMRINFPLKVMLYQKCLNLSSAAARTPTSPKPSAAAPLTTAYPFQTMTCPSTSTANAITTFLKKERNFSYAQNQSSSWKRSINSKDFNRNITQES